MPRLSWWWSRMPSSSDFAVDFAVAVAVAFAFAVDFASPDLAP